MSTENNPNAAIVTSFSILQAEAQVHQAILEEILRHIGLHEIQGFPVQQWMEKQRAIQLEKILLAMGDKDPVAYALVADCLANAKKNSRPI